MIIRSKRPPTFAEISSTDFGTTFLTKKDEIFLCNNLINIHLITITTFKTGI